MCVGGGSRAHSQFCFIFKVLVIEYPDVGLPNIIFASIDERQVKKSGDSIDLVTLWNAQLSNVTKWLFPATSSQTIDSVRCD